MEYKNTVVRTFNNIFENVFSFVLELYPDNPHIIAGQISYKRAIALNHTIIIKAWYKWIYLPYKNDLHSNGIDFFFEKEYSGDVEGMANAGVILQAIEQLRAPMQQMDAEHKQMIQTKLIHLNKLSKKFCE